MSHQMVKRGLLGGAGITVFIAAVHAVNDMLTATLGVLLPTLQEQLRADNVTLAALVTVFTLASSVTQPVFGAAAERWGMRRVAAGGVAVAAVSLSVVPLSSSVVVTFGLVAAGGVGSAALHPVSTAIIGSASTRAGIGIGLFTAGGMIGYAVGPILVLAVLAAAGPAAAPWLMVPGLLAAISMLLLPKWAPHGPAVTYSSARAREIRAVLPLMGATTAIALVFLAFTSAVPLWLVHEHGLAVDAPYIGVFAAIFAVAAAAGAVIGGLAATRIGSVPLTILTAVGAVPALGSVLALPPGPTQLVAGFVGGALLYASQSIFILAGQRAVSSAPALGAGMVIGGASAVAAMLYLALGYASDLWGLTATMALTLITLVATITLATIARKTIRLADASATRATESGT